MAFKKLISNDSWRNIKKLRENGCTYQKIANMYGVTRQSIQQGLAKKYVKYRKI